MINNRLCELEKRQDIFNTIQIAPGLHLREISRRTNMPFTTLRYHINYLIKRNLIESRKEGRFVRFYVTENIGRNNKDLLNLLRQKTIRKIILILFLHIPTLTELSRYLEYYTNKGNGKEPGFCRSPPCIYSNLKKLIDADVIERVNIENEIRYIIKNIEEVSDLLITYKKSFFDKQIDPIMEFNKKQDKFAKKSDKERIDGLLNLIHDIFPPYLYY